MTSRVVFDTNIFVSAYAFGGNPATLMRVAIKDEIALVTSAPILAELARVLADKLGFDGDHVESVILQIARVAEVVSPKTRLAIIEDDADNRVLECALEGDADIVVSGDRHLLSIGAFEGIRIITPAEMLEALG